MLLWGIFISAFLIGFSGAMMPGPMLGVTVDGSLKKGYLAGPLIVFGHALLELSIVVILVLGLKDFLSNPIVAGLIGFFGGIYLLWMGYGMIRSGILRTVSLNIETQETVGTNLILAGILTSATNPYFIMWWATTGIEMIRQSLTIGIIGLIIFYIGHILSDFTWFSAVSMAISKGKKLINDDIYRLVIILLGVFITGFSVYFIYSAFNMLI
ncbi:LysE family transporter [Thermoanaerobacterium sp. RBIITD]|uniref:LysE family transporter n=1 Tax=Thermoanaerobacterium sp. RBIITD TaxID=1550240 RepID=UPI000BB79CAF|nr:LysE family transporter [Thermoanaerobacterium sp. RBIITD]SNX54506.1 Threonine/homoserine/homoserine lactone efflux protein [Thermoanaerobacterium sp. RBIITD]